MVQMCAFLVPSGWLLQFYGPRDRNARTCVTNDVLGLFEGFFGVLFTKKMFSGIKHIIKSVVLAKCSMHKHISLLFDHMHELLRCMPVDGAFAHAVGLLGSLYVGSCAV